MGWAWLALALVAGPLLAVAVAAVIEWSHSERPRSDWDRMRGALGRAVERARRTM